jgi:hypothetical protein
MPKSGRHFLDKHEAQQKIYRHRLKEPFARLVTSKALNGRLS